MPIAHPIQPGILETIPAHAAYLTFQLRLGANPREVLGQLAEQTDGLTTVVGLGASLVHELGAQVPGLKTFQGIEGALVKLPATPIDLLIWLRGDDRGDILAHGQSLAALLAPAFELESITEAFNHDGGKDLTGYEDGTENPTGDEALTAAFVPTGNGAPEGSSFLALQRWHHQLRHFDAMPRDATRPHLRPRARSATKKWTTRPSRPTSNAPPRKTSSPEAFVLRRSMPWSEGNEGGLVFTAFGHSFDAFEALLRRMSGAEDGLKDALFTFTEPQTGAYLWCPPMHQGRLDLRRNRFVARVTAIRGKPLRRNTIQPRVCTTPRLTNINQYKPVRMHAVRVPCTTLDGDNAMAHIVILGAGIGGMPMAYEMKELARNGRHRHGDQRCAQVPLCTLQSLGGCRLAQAQRYRDRHCSRTGQKGHPVHHSGRQTGAPGKESGGADGRHPPSTTTTW